MSSARFPVPGWSTESGRTDIHPELPREAPGAMSSTISWPISSRCTAAGAPASERDGTGMNPPPAPDPAASGERRIALLAPKSGWDRPRFERYWLDSHGPLVATTPDYGSYRGDYVQDHVLEDGLGAEPFPFAGVASVRMPGGEVPNFSSTAVFRDRILPDEEHFLDREGCLAVRVHEQRIRGGRGAVKCVAFGAFDRDCADASSLAAAHDVLPEQAPRPSGILLGEVLAQPTDLGGALRSGAPRIDWVEETRFECVRDALEHFSARRLHRLAVPRWAFISDEHVLFAAGRPNLD